MKCLLFGLLVLATAAFCYGAEDDCAPITDQAACCNTTVVNCTFCDDGKCYENVTDCSSGVDVCTATTTAAPTTAIPSTIGPVVNCTQYNESACCDQGTICGLCQMDDNTTACTNLADDGTCANNSTNSCSSTASTIAPIPTTDGNATSISPVTSTAAPTSAPAPPPCDDGQHFDAASFMGGIILCAAIIAISYFGCRIYKGKTEQKYQQF